MSGRERWIMAAIFALGALYFFEWQALYLYGVGALIYLFTRGKK
jgi:hypothetical protein